MKKSVNFARKIFGSKIDNIWDRIFIFNSLLYIHKFKFLRNIYHTIYKIFVETNIPINYTKSQFFEQLLSSKTSAIRTHYDSFTVELFNSDNNYPCWILIILNLTPLNTNFIHFVRFLPPPDPIPSTDGNLTTRSISHFPISLAREIIEIVLSGKQSGNFRLEPIWEMLYIPDLEADLATNRI